MAGEIVNSSSSGTSFPTSMDSPEVDWGLQLSQMLSSLGTSMLNWAVGVYNQTAAAVAPAVAEAMKSAQFSYQQAQTLWSQYTTTYAPEMKLLAQEAGDYGSAARQAFNAGQAESATMQASNQAKQNAIQTLTEEGVNPDSGMYQEAVLAAGTQAAAAAAGAGTQASMNTAAQGRQLLQNSIGVGEQLPGATVNAINAGLSSLANAENTNIAVGNLGINASQAGVGYENAAANALKIPPVGQISRSASQTNAQPAGNQNQGGTNSGNQNAKAPAQDSPLIPETLATGGGTNTLYKNLPNGQDTGAYDPQTGAYNPTDNGNPYAGGATVGGTPYAGDPFGQVSPYAGGATVGGVPYPGDPLGQLNDYYTGQASPGAVNPYDTSGGIDISGSGPTAPPIDLSGGGGNPTEPPVDTYNPPPIDYTTIDTSAPPPDTGTTDTSGDSTDTSGDSTDGGGGGGGYAQGGAIPARSRPSATTGGFAHAGLSPSRGRQTDDISARLNAGEFVIPRDVVHDKGHEFFRNLIQKSRKNRLGMGAAQQPIGPQMKSPIPGPPRFVSHVVGGR